jgi:tetratricopeptide (TPR) repeat protein
MPDAAIVIQNFNKPDTLHALCESLLKCGNTRRFDLIFWSDSAHGSRKEAQYLPKTAQVKELLDAFSAAHGDRFNSITIQRNPVNYGCYKTCQIAMDMAFERHEFVIFSEDDTVFAPDALDWFMMMRNSPAFLDDSIWAIAGESIFFDGGKVVPDRQLVEAAKVYAKANRLWQQFIPFDFIPSTCFATNQKKWAQFSATRGEPVGDVLLCQRCRNEGKKCLFPVVARVKDTGMLHPDGYSVLIHTEENVTGVKNCYLMSDDIHPDSGTKPDLAPFDGDAGKLFWRSTLLNGFGEATTNLLTEAAPVSQQFNLLQDARRAGIESDWDLALRLWRELKQGGLTTPEVDTNIGLCLLKTGQQEESRNTIESVLSIHPDEAFTQLVMAYILEADREFAGAANIWNRLRNRDGLPDWIRNSSIDGEARCKAAALALKF